MMKKKQKIKRKTLINNKKYCEKNNFLTVFFYILIKENIFAYFFKKYSFNTLTFNILCVIIISKKNKGVKYAF